MSYFVFVLYIRLSSVQLGFTESVNSSKNVLTNPSSFFANDVHIKNELLQAAQVSIFSY